MTAAGTLALTQEGLCVCGDLPTKPFGNEPWALEHLPIIEDPRQSSNTFAKDCIDGMLFSVMKIAIVADWLTTFGGAEHVIAAISSLWPEAPLFTTVARRNALGPLSNSTIRTSVLQRVYRLLGKHQLLLPWMPRTVESIDLSGFDIIISSSHAVAKGIVPPPGAVHVCYCHTPMRYAWEMEEQYLTDFHIPHFLRSRVRGLLKRLRRWDLGTAKRVDHFIANSAAIQERIARIYGRESVVIPPPVHERFFAPTLRPPSPTQPYFLAVGRFVPYKRFDLLIEAANTLRLPLWIAGTGHDEERLRSLAGPTVRFLGYVPDDDLPSLYAGAQALLFPQLEDAGLVLRESLACGTPVIALRAGGALDAIRERETGLFMAAQTVESLLETLRAFSAVPWNRDAIRAYALPFSEQAFALHLQNSVLQAYERYRLGGDISPSL